MHDILHSIYYVLYTVYNMPKLLGVLRRRRVALPVAADDRGARHGRWTVAGRRAGCRLASDEAVRASSARLHMQRGCWLNTWGGRYDAVVGQEILR